MKIELFGFNSVKLGRWEGTESKRIIGYLIRLRFIIVLTYSFVISVKMAKSKIDDSRLHAICSHSLRECTFDGIQNLF